MTDKLNLPKKFERIERRIKKGGYYSSEIEDLLTALSNARDNLHAAHGELDRLHKENREARDEAVLQSTLIDVLFSRCQDVWGEKKTNDVRKQVDKVIEDTLKAERANND